MSPEVGFVSPANRDVSLVWPGTYLSRLWGVCQQDDSVESDFSLSSRRRVGYRRETDTK